MMKKFVKENSTIIAFGTLVHLVAVIFSEGYHRPDEHLAVIHMMQFKLGSFPENLLSWEFPVKIRPWIQPFFQYGISKIYYLLGAKNPFYLAGIFRFIFSTLGLISLLLISFHGQQFIKSESKRKWTIVIAMMLSYIPFFQARATGENIGISLFIFGMSFLITQINSEIFSITTIKAILAGLFFGLSFFMRFQMGVMIFTFMLWLLIFTKIRWKKWITVCFGIALAIGICVYIDYWGYGEWTFSPWNYIYQNILLGKVSGFGISPWYYYITKTFMKGIPPLSLAFIVPFLWLWIKKPNHILTWTTLPFFFVHSLIGHKELRFIFGMGLFLPIIVPLFVENFNLDRFKGKKSLKILFFLMIVENFTFMAISSLRPAFSPINFYKKVYYKDEVITKMYTLRIFRDQLPFYLPNPIEWISHTKIKDVQQTIQKESVSWFLTNNYSDIIYMRGVKECEEDYISYPNWVFKLNISNWLKRSKIWALYRCSSIQSK